MKPKAFRDWRSRLGITQAGAGRLLGKTERMIRYYETGVKEHGETIEIPKAIRLACWALEHGPEKPKPPTS